MKYKLIAFDLDGTFLNSDKTISKRNLTALSAAAEAGAVVVPATGRIFSGLPGEISSLPFMRWNILVNGAAVFDAYEKKTIHKEEISAEYSLGVMEYMDTLPIIYDCYKNDWGFISRNMYEIAEKYIPDPGILHLLRSLRTPVDDLADFIKADGGSVQKLQMYFNDPSLRIEQLEKLPELFPELSVTTSISNNIELNSKKANKGSAMAFLCAELGIDISETAAFGDGTNDLSMLAAAGLGVAMENADPSVKAVAKHIAPPNDAAGVGQVIELMLEDKI